MLSKKNNAMTGLILKSFKQNAHQGQKGNIGHFKLENKSNRSFKSFGLYGYEKMMIIHSLWLAGFELSVGATKREGLGEPPLFS